MQKLADLPKPDLDNVPAIMQQSVIAEFGRNFRAS